MSDAPIELIAHGDGWRNVEYIRADVANARIAAAEDTATQAIRVAVDLQGQVTAANERIAELEAAQRAQFAFLNLTADDSELLFSMEE